LPKYHKQELLRTLQPILDSPDTSHTDVKRCVERYYAWTMNTARLYEYLDRTQAHEAAQALMDLVPPPSIVMIKNLSPDTLRKAYQGQGSVTTRTLHQILHSTDRDGWTIEQCTALADCIRARPDLVDMWVHNERAGVDVGYNLHNIPSAHKRTFLNLLRDFKLTFPSQRSES